MNAGNLKWVARIETAPTNKSATGDAANAEQWPMVGKRRVKIEEVSGTKSDEGVQQRVAVAWYTVTMRYMPELNPKMRLVISGRPWTGKVMYVNFVRHTKTETSASCVIRSNK